MSPMNALHANVVARLAHLLTLQVHARLVVRTQLPLALTETDEPEPDLCIAHRPTDVFQPHPTSAALVVEVAVSSLDYDRNVKLALYARCLIAEYWIVDCHAQAIEVYSGPSNGTYASKRTVSRGGAVDSTVVAGLRVAVDEIFGSASSAE